MVFDVRGPRDEIGPAAALRVNQGWAKPGPWQTKLSPLEEKEFLEWAKANPQRVRGEMGPTADYDVRGLWKGIKSGDPEAKQAANGHFSDKWKTPYHRSFSAESIYATKGAPTWHGNKLVTPDGRVLFDEDKK